MGSGYDHVNVDFDENGKTIHPYPVGALITDIEVEATGYTTAYVDDHTIVKETEGDENKAQTTLQIKKVMLHFTPKFGIRHTISKFLSVPTHY